MTSVSLDNERLAVIDLDDLDDDCKDYVDALLHVGLINEEDLKNPLRFCAAWVGDDSNHRYIETYGQDGNYNSYCKIFPCGIKYVVWDLEDSEMINRNRALSVLGGNEWAKGLHVLWLFDSALDEYHLENLFFQVIPNLPYLREVHLNIDMRPGIVERFTAMRDRLMANDPTMGAISKSLKKVHFHVNNGGLHLEPEFLAFLDAFLNIFVQTSVFVDYARQSTQGPRSVEAQACFDRLEYTSITNVAGRRLVEGAKIWKNDFKHPPLSIWPIVLERTQRNLSLNHANKNTFHFRFQGKKSLSESDRTIFLEVLEPDIQSASARATGMYYLLRHSPALLGRSNLIDSGSSAIPNNRKRRRFNSNI